MIFCSVHRLEFLSRNLPFPELSTELAVVVWNLCWELAVIYSMEFSVFQCHEAYSDNTNQVRNQNHLPVTYDFDCIVNTGNYSNVLNTFLLVLFFVVPFFLLMFNFSFFSKLIFFKFWNWTSSCKWFDLNDKWILNLSKRFFVLDYFDFKIQW